MMTIRLRLIDDLTKLRLRERPEARSRILAAKLKLLLCFITDTTMKGRNKTTVISIRSTLKALPYYSCSGNLAQIHGQFNNLVSTTCKTEKELEKLTSLYDLDLFSLNTTFN